ncbi:MAG: endonuclease III domain-containing protein [Nitrospiria bacterium]
MSLITRKGQAKHAQENPTPESTIVLDIYRRLYEALRPQGWWPAETRFEVMVGVVLTQNTAWSNVEKAIGVLRRRDLLDLEAVRVTPEKVLARHIRSSGYFNRKAQRLKALVDFIVRTYGGALDRMFSQKGEHLRKALLAVKGLGPESVDSILLYAGDMPFFVVDTYTRRVFSRHGLVDAAASYGQVQGYFMNRLPRDPALFQEYHALIVKTAKQFCRKEAACTQCPLGNLPGLSPYPSPKSQKNLMFDGKARNP